MLKGFKEFLMRGNIVELSVAVAVGVALVTLVTAFTDLIIDPILAALGPSGSLGLGFTIRDSIPASFVDIGGLISAIIAFAITMAAIYFLVVVPMQKVMARYKKPEEEVVEQGDETVELLREIRNLLQQQNTPGTGGTTPTI